MLEFVGDYIEPHQLGRTEGRRNGDIGRVAAFSNHDTADPGMVMPRIESEPPTIKKYLVPRAKIHRSWIDWDADVTKIARAIPGWDVHAPGKRNREMSEVPANATTFLVPLKGRAVTSRVMVAEFNTVVSVVANRLRTLPAALDASKERPGKVRELFGVAVSTRQ